ncbi:serine hydrolase domain-containing protein [Streptomyces albireticuli]|uniref:Serine hydrolase n=1 Tax=Streptomyces albireticuli TaxID=1940 RepID=A0A2A2DAW2_9ACTN|nr:serine hydrolase domain-containing protein [Streptomyces albireticuli]MCD9143745.1 beta-lactamase family protein [Streptomyces albireticuli]MCD9161824.1 beta-lactamase family protein [Streptomyces albireticuli]MCD9191862.1 beta-lactamase family protein [Streptomyces albireticuli]PAU48621.1 serine hydrolase [Streptomyces albireticuli]
MITHRGHHEERPEEKQFTELLPETRRALLHRLALGQREGRTPSMTGAVMRDGRVVWSGGRGTTGGEAVDADTQYRVGSITKTFVAVLIMRLRDEGLLDLDAPLRTYLDDVPEGGDATVAQLLSHTAGLAAEARGPWWERTDGELRPELADLFGERSQLHRAGRRHHYSNPGYALLGAVVERLRGEPWGEALRREVLLPLGMHRTSTAPEAPYAEGWAVHPWADALLPEPAVDTGRMAPAGQLWSTAGDLCRFAAFLLDGDERVLGAASVAEMRVPESGPEDPGWTSGYGLGLQVARRNGRTLVGHTGSMPGFVATLWVSPEEGLAAVVLANRTSCFEVAPTATDLLNTVAEREPRFPAPWQPLAEVDPALLALTGPWYWGATGFALRLGTGRALELSPLAGGGRASRFRPEEDGTWTGLDGYYAGETLKVVRTDEGAVSHLDLGTFVFTREPYEQGSAVPGGVDEAGWR